MVNITQLAVPTSPLKVTGSVAAGSDPGAQDPKGPFTAHVIYPSADAHFYLDGARPHGQWEIDYLAFEWKEKPLTSLKRTR